MRAYKLHAPRHPIFALSLPLRLLLRSLSRPSLLLTRKPPTQALPQQPRSQAKMIAATMQRSSVHRTAAARPALAPRARTQSRRSLRVAASAQVDGNKPGIAKVSSDLTPHNHTHRQLCSSSHQLAAPHHTRGALVLHACVAQLHIPGHTHPHHTNTHTHSNFLPHLSLPLSCQFASPSSLPTASACPQTKASLASSPLPSSGPAAWP